MHRSEMDLSEVWRLEYQQALENPPIAIVRLQIEQSEIVIHLEDYLAEQDTVQEIVVYSSKWDGWTSIGNQSTENEFVMQTKNVLYLYGSRTMFLRVKKRFDTQYYPLQLPNHLMKSNGDVIWIRTDDSGLCVLDIKYEAAKIRIYNFYELHNRYYIAVNEDTEFFFNKGYLIIKQRHTNLKLAVVLEKEASGLYFFERANLPIEVSEQYFRGDIMVLLTTIETDEDQLLPLEIPSKQKFFSIFQAVNGYSSTMLYRNNAGNLSIASNYEQYLRNEQLTETATLKKIEVTGECLSLTVAWNQSSLYEVVGLHIHHRKSADWMYRTFDAVNAVEKKDTIYLFYQINVHELEWKQFYLDTYLKLRDKDGHDYFAKIIVTNSWIRRRLQYLLNSNQFLLTGLNGETYLLVPYVTQGKTLSLNYRVRGKYETRPYKTREYLAVAQYLLLGWWKKRQNIWLVYEKFSETAQDNGYYFFTHMYENHPNQKVFFVIDKNSKDFTRLNGMSDRVLAFMSVRHLFYLLCAQLIVASDTKGHGFAWRTTKGFIKPCLNKKPYVFLQHGVLGLKKVDSTFSANGISRADLFVTSSQREKKLVIDYLGYKPNQVIVTGLSRWDYLHQCRLEKNDSVLIMPTWRTWLEEVDEDIFLQSEYFTIYVQMINSHWLGALLEKHGLIANFYLHPKFMQYAPLFETTNTHVKIISFGEVPVNQLISEASLLITDYSSVAWEALYQEIPTVFYQFDQADYVREQGAYLDLNSELFGPVVKTQEELADAVEELLSISDTAYLAKEAKNAFEDIDQHNAERTYQEIVSFQKAEKGYKSSTIFRGAKKIFDKVRGKK